MSDREFENYLTLLASLLRLDGKQRGAIAEELRSHMEDRLEELMARGVSREDAVRQALAEFGDAAGLAGQFAAISCNRKRRWLMRLTTFSVAATLLLAASLAIFWPGRNAGPGLAAVVAQAPQEADPFAPGPPTPDALPPEAKVSSKKAKPPGKLSAANRIDEELDKLTDVDLVETPLKDVLEFLKDKHSIPIVLKLKKLEEASVSPDTPVTKSLRGIRLSSALNILLDDLDLTYLVKDEVLQITTADDAKSTLEIRIYDCRDILAMPAPGQERVGAAADAVPGAAGMLGAVQGFGMGFVSEHDKRASQLMTIITTNVDPQSWQVDAPATDASRASPPRSPGSISEYNGLIVVTQTAHTDSKIEHVLDMLREAAGLEAPKTGKVVR